MYETPKRYISRVAILSGTSLADVQRQAKLVYRAIESRTKRTPYIRSAYFQNQKVFLTLFWPHLFQKNWRDRVRRLKLFACALDVIRRSTRTPMTVENPNDKNELLHRFYAQTRNGLEYVVQVKEDKKTGKKYLLSAFPG